MNRAIEIAKSDDNIQGIYLDLNFYMGGTAQARSIREALVDFKESGKFIVAYSKYYTQAAYYIASVADEVHLNPVGGVEFKGYGATLNFFTGMLDKIGVKANVFYAGQFKSATEPFRRYDMSEQNRTQVREYISDMYQSVISDISTSREKSKAELNAFADDFDLWNADKSLAAGMIDKISYEDEVLSSIRSKVGLDADDKISKVAMADYAKAKKTLGDFSIKDKIAVIYAEGTIVDGKGGKGQIGDRMYVDEIRKARKNKKVKAIVLRINSGGGSAMASENMWREVELAKADGLPVVVSMGALAASGGYYMSCNADEIFAEETTLTGSIGVFSIFPDVSELMNDKLGITVDTVQTNDFSTALNPMIPLSARERAIMQGSADAVYQTFLTRVKEGRGFKTIAEVDAIAQGRVWTGKRAVQNGLVDKIGDLDDALAAAADKAGISAYRLAEYPKIKDPLTELLEDFTGAKTSIKQDVIKTELGEYYRFYEQAKAVQAMEGPQVMLPFVLEVQ